MRNVSQTQHEERLGMSNVSQTQHKEVLSGPKRRDIKFTRRGITHKKAQNFPLDLLKFITATVSLAANHCDR